MPGLIIWPVPDTTSIDVSRPNYDSRGNRNPVNFTLPNVIVSLQAALTRPRLGEGQENRFIQDGAVYVQRGTTGPGGIPALQAGDEVTYNGEIFTVAGNARGNQLHPQTGSDFGWMGFRIQGAG